MDALDALDALPVARCLVDARMATLDGDVNVVDVLALQVAGTAELPALASDDAGFNDAARCEASAAPSTSGSRPVTPSRGALRRRLR